MNTWNDVNESLPTKDGYYMCRLREVKDVVGEEECICRYDEQKGCFEKVLNRYDYFKTIRVTHWRELKANETLD